MTTMDGKALRDDLLKKYKTEIEEQGLKIRLDIITVGENAANEVYVRNKVKYANAVGIEAVVHKLDEVTEDEIISLIEELNETPEVTGIILQSPLAEGLDFDACASRIVADKDVDGFTMANTDALYHGRAGSIPCTVKGIIFLLEHYGVQLAGANVTIIGRGNIVGKPLALALMNKDATVTLCHSKTRNLKEHTQNADIVISAVGKRNVVTGDMVAEGFVGIDVGITHEGGHLYGDFEAESTRKKASFLTPVPGGVGPMTVAMIIDNLIEAKRRER